MYYIPVKISGNIGNEGAAALAQDTYLTSLSIGHLIDDAGVSVFISNKTLRSLKLNDNKITDSVAIILAKMDNLLSLALGYNQVGDAGAEEIAKNTRSYWQ
jgi:hypothetical protein